MRELECFSDQVFAYADRELKGFGDEVCPYFQVVWIENWKALVMSFLHIPIENWKRLLMMIFIAPKTGRCLDRELVGQSFSTMAVFWEACVDQRAPGVSECSGWMVWNVKVGCYWKGIWWNIALNLLQLVTWTVFHPYRNLLLAGFARSAIYAFDCFVENSSSWPWIWGPISESPAPKSWKMPQGGFPSFGFLRREICRIRQKPLESFQAAQIYFVQNLALQENVSLQKLPATLANHANFPNVQQIHPWGIYGLWRVFTCAFGGLNDGKLDGANIR